MQFASHTPRQSLTAQVAAKVAAIGACDGDDLAPHFPEHSRTQILRALNNACANELLEPAEPGVVSRGNRKGVAPKKYQALRDRPPAGALTRHLQLLLQFLWR